MPVLFVSLSAPKHPHSLMALMFVFMLLGAHALHASTAALTSEDIRKILNDFLLTASANSSLHEQPVSTNNIRATLHDYLDAGLLPKALKADGTNFTFVLPHQQTESQIEALILTYHDKETATGMHKMLVGKGDIFKNTLILTRFSSVAVGRHLLIIFTEKSGNAAVVKLVNEFPKVMNNGCQNKFKCD